MMEPASKEEKKVKKKKRPEGLSLFFFCFSKAVLGCSFVGRGERGKGEGRGVGRVGGGGKGGGVGRLSQLACLVKVFA